MAPQIHASLDKPFTKICNNTTLLSDSPNSRNLGPFRSLGHTPREYEHVENPSAETWSWSREESNSKPRVSSEVANKDTHIIKDTLTVVVINLQKEPSELRDVIKANNSIVYHEKSWLMPQDANTTDGSSLRCSSLKLLVSDLKRDVWFVVDNVPDVDSQAQNIIDALAEYRKESMCSAKLSPSSFPIQIFIIKPTKKRGNLPRSNESVRYVSFPFRTPKDLADILERQYQNRKRKVEEIVGRPITDAYCQLVIKLYRSEDDIITADELPYIKDSYTALEEHLRDPNSSTRQQSHHWYKIPNLRVVETVQEDAEQGRGTVMRMVVEVRPLHLQGLTLLVDQVRNGDLADMVRQNLQVRRQEFLGSVSIEMDGKSLPSTKEFLRENNALVGSDVASDRNCVGSLREIIVTKYYQEHLNDPKKLPSDYISFLRSQGLELMLDHVRNNEGRNAIHMAISSGRVDFLRMLFFQNKWGQLRKEIVNATFASTQKHVGFTPRRLAEALAFTTKGQDVLEQYDNLENCYLNLTTLSRASLNGQLELVKILVEADPSVVRESSESNELPALVCASAAGHKDIVEHLLQKRAVEQVRGHESAIHVALEFGYEDIVEIFDKYVVDLTGRKNEDGLNAIDYCAKVGATRTLRLFHKKNFPIPKTCIMAAVKYSRASILDYLLDKCKLDVNQALDKETRSVLHQVAISGDTSILKKLLSSGAKLTFLNKYGANALHIAAEYNQPSIAEGILEAAKSSGVLEKLINAQDVFTGRDIYYLIRGRDRGRRAWHWLELRRMSLHLFQTALSQGQLDVADYGKVLHSGFGPGPGRSTNDQMQARQDAALEPSNQKLDMTPLHYAACKERLEVAKVLLEYGADPNIQDNFGATPAHHAAMRGNLPILIALAEGGAKLEARTSSGKTVLDVAMENGHQEVINYLESNPLLLITRKFVTEAIFKIRAELDSGLLMEKRAQGRDIRQHLIAALRELSIDINSYLLQLGSGPVLEATSD